MKRPALGHILGYTALTVILTAGAAQSLAGSNTVFSDDIVDFSIVANDIKTAAIGGRPIVDNSLTGTDVNEATLVLTCPTGMTKRGDLCFGPLLGPTQILPAVNDCAADNLRLPSYSEAKLIAETEVFIWVDTLYYVLAGGGRQGVAVGAVFDDVEAAESAAYHYRCVTTVGARP